LVLPVHPVSDRDTLSVNVRFSLGGVQRQRHRMIGVDTESLKVSLDSTRRATHEWLAYLEPQHRPVTLRPVGVGLRGRQQSREAIVACCGELGGCLWSDHLKA